LLVARWIAPVQAVENARQCFGRDADAGVLHAQVDRATASVRDQCDLSPLRRVAQCIADQVAQDLYHSLFVYVDLG